VDEGASGLTFEEWDPSADTDSSEVPVAMIETDSRYGNQEKKIKKIKNLGQVFRTNHRTR
jgi:hypothetical protein